MENRLKIAEELNRLPIGKAITYPMGDFKGIRFTYSEWLEGKEAIDCVLDLVVGSKYIIKTFYDESKKQITFERISEKDIMKKQTREEILEKHCPSMSPLYLDNVGRAFRDRVFAAMEEYAKQFFDEDKREKAKSA